MSVVIALAGLLVIAAVAAVVVGGVLALRKTKVDYDRSSRLAPNLSSSAPTSWAGSHDPEARLHRRLRDALAALAANQAFDDDGRLLDIRVELEQQAVALDDQLVATAALPLSVRSDPLTRITGAVESLERAVADLAGTSASEAAGRLTLALDDIRTRTSTVAQAQAALDALPPAATPAAGPLTTSPPAPATSPPAPASGPPTPAPPAAPPAASGDDEPGQAPPTTGNA